MNRNKFLTRVALATAVLALDPLSLLSEERKDDPFKSLNVIEYKEWSEKYFNDNIKAMPIGYNIERMRFYQNVVLGEVTLDHVARMCTRINGMYAEKAISGNKMFHSVQGLCLSNRFPTFEDGKITEKVIPGPKRTLLFFYMESDYTLEFLKERYNNTFSPEGELIENIPIDNL